MKKIELSRRQVIGAIAATPLLATPARASLRTGFVMVQGRPQDTGSLYKFGNIMTALDALGGVRKMRCREPYSGTAGWNTYIALARAGVRFCFTLSVREPARSIADLRMFMQTVPGSIWAIEYPNEPDLNPVTYKGTTDRRLGFRTGAAPALMAYITDMHRLIRADTTLRQVPPIASNDYMQAQQKPHAHFANSHIYPRPTAIPADVVDGFDNKVKTGGYTAGVVTEWGRTTGGTIYNATSPPVTLSQQATLLGADLEAAIADPRINTLSFYELFSWPGTSEMDNFGLFNADLTPRPVVRVIRSILI